MILEKYITDLKSSTLLIKSTRGIESEMVLNTLLNLRLASIPMVTYSIKWVQRQRNLNRSPNLSISIVGSAKDVLLTIQDYGMNCREIFNRSCKQLSFKLIILYIPLNTFKWTQSSNSNKMFLLEERQDINIINN